MDDSRVGRFVRHLARLAAIAGGAVLVVVMLSSVVSIAGRALIWTGLGFRPIPGDYEIVEAGVLFAVFCFLPWTQLTNGHAVVGVLTDRLPVRFNVLIVALWDWLMFGLAVFIAWRHYAGLIDKFNYRETTLLLRLPLWWIYAGGMVGAVIFVIVAAYCAVRSSVAATARQPRTPESGFIE